MQTDAAELPTGFTCLVFIVVKLNMAFHIIYNAEPFIFILNFKLLLTFLVGNTAEIIHKMPMPWLTY
jgi:hypothetical protein